MTDLQIIDQPRRILTGEELIKNLNSSDFDQFYIMVAYVRKSGVIRLQSHLQKFRKHGKIYAIAGIDSKNSSKEGLELLHKNVDELRLYHNNNFYQIFHPKLYVFVKTSKKALIIIGSSNLTFGGLFGNYELCSINELDLSKSSDKKHFDKIIEIFNDYSAKTNESCKPFSKKLINELVKRNIIPVEKLQAVRRRTNHFSQKIKLTPLFGNEIFKKPTKKLVIPKYNVLELGFWKKLSNNDVSLTSSPGQIIIPKKFMTHFPPIENYQQTPSCARQGDVFFDISFKYNNEKPQIIEGVRAIHYIPAPTHPRPNQELRFTFRNRSIFNKLSAGDILLFKETESDIIWFEIQCNVSNSLKGLGQKSSYGKL